MQGRGSKNKGANGEREFAALLVAHGFKAKRQGRQFFSPEGVRDHQDVIHNVAGIHFEVKRREKVEPPRWMKQAREESKGLTPVVAFRQNRQPWRIVIDADDFLDLMETLRDQAVTNLALVEVVKEALEKERADTRPALGSPPLA